MKQTIENYGIRLLGSKLREAKAVNYVGLENNEFTRIENEGEFLTLIEDYTMEKVGIYNDSRGITEFDYRPANISDLLSIPSKIEDRKTPFELAFPARRKTILQVDVPNTKFRAFESEITSPYHHFKHKGEYVGETFQITYEYKILKDHIPPKALKEHRRQVYQIYKEIYFRIFTFNQTPDAKNTVAQPGLKNKFLDRKLTTKDLKHLLYDLMNREPKATKKGRKEVADLLKMEAVTPFFAENIFAQMINFFSTHDQMEEAIFYVDQRAKKRGLIGYRTLLEKARIYKKFGQFSKAANSIEKVLKIRKPRVGSSDSNAWHDQLREYYWQMQDFERLMPVLEHLVEHDPRGWHNFRELGVVYDLLGLTEKALQIRKKQVELEYSDPYISLPGEFDEQLRNPRRVYRADPIYPYAALKDEVMGTVVVKFTITPQGKTKDCQVVEARPAGYFEEAACAAADLFYYYPRDPSEPDGDVENFPYKMVFELDD